MDIDRLHELWTEHNERIDKVCSLNLQLLREHKLGQVRSTLRGQAFGNLVGMITSVAMVVWMGLHVAANVSSSWTATVPALVVAVLSQLAFFGSARQLGLTRQVELSGPVVASQAKVAQLRLAKVRFGRGVLLGSWFFLWSLFFVGFGLDPAPVIEEVWRNAPIVVIVHGSLGVLWIPLGLLLLRLYDRRDLRSPLLTRLRDDSKLTEASVSRSLNEALAYLGEVRAFERNE